MVIIFLLDNTPLMLQQSMMTGVRNSYMDIAKQTVEKFMELSFLEEDKQHGRYMLLTYDIPPNNVKVGWNENLAQFKNALNTLQCTGSLPEGKALRNVFELLNQERMMIGLDTYGYGRCPFNNMPTYIVHITSYHYRMESDTSISSFCPNVAGSQLTKEPFRWDQRLFALILDSSKIPPCIAKLVLAMGGCCMQIRTKKSWDQIVPQLLKNLKFELMVNFIHEVTPVGRIAETSITKLEPSNCAIAYCGKTWKGSWPLPESYWPHLEQQELPPRDAIPELRILPVCCDEPVWKVALPVDKYELRERTDRKSVLPTTDPGKIWPVVIMSSTNRKEQPFGYLKRVNRRKFFYVLPYNYPELHRLMEEHYPLWSANNHKFIYDMRYYLSLIPPYYCWYLSKALSGILDNQTLNLVLPNESVYCLNHGILFSLNQMRQTATFNRTKLCDYVSKQQDKVEVKQLEIAPLINEHPLLKRRKEANKCVVKTIVVPTNERSISIPDYRKLYEIDRKDLIDMIHRMRNAFYYPKNVSNCMNSLKHTVSILQMQNYTAVQQSVTSLRTLTDSENTEDNLFSTLTRRREHQRK